MTQIKDLKRMCDFFGDCSKCELFEPSKVCGVCLFPDNIDEIVDKWVKEHPVKTYSMDFFEKFPNALKTESGRPDNCRNLIYGDKPGCNYECEECWNQEMEE